MSSEQVQEYRGVMTLPGEQEERGVSLSLDAVAPSVSIRYDEPIDGSSDWQAEGLTVANRLKYNEVVFYTTGLPKETGQVTWEVQQQPARRFAGGRGDCARQHPAGYGRKGLCADQSGLG